MVKRYAVIENGIVVNVIDGPENFTIEGVNLVAAPSAGIGDSYNNSVFTPKPKEPSTYTPSPPLEVESFILIKRDSVTGEVTGRVPITLDDQMQLEKGEPL